MHLMKELLLTKVVSTCARLSCHPRLEADIESCPSKHFGSSWQLVYSRLCGFREKVDKPQTGFELEHISKLILLNISKVPPTMVSNMSQGYFEVIFQAILYGKFLSVPFQKWASFS